MADGDLLQRRLLALQDLRSARNPLRADQSVEIVADRQLEFRLSARGGIDRRPQILRRTGVLIEGLGADALLARKLGAQGVDALQE